MKNVIYTINARPRSRRRKTFPDIEWERLPLERFQYYAEKVSADFVQINEDPIPLLSLPVALTPYQACNMLKFYLFNQFINSDYDRMLYLDLDILIKKEARNIFEQVECKGIHMTVSENEAQETSQKYWLKNHFNLDCSSRLYNGGIIYADKNSIKKFYRNVPQLGEWLDFYKKYNLEQNLISPDGGEINEQNLLAFFFHKQHTLVHELPLNWNKPALYQDKDDDFIHYYGPGGKFILEELYGLERNVYFYF